MLSPHNARIAVLAVLFIASFNSIFAQSDFKPGFIITNSNDTIRGFIDYKKNSINAKECVFKKTDDTEKKTYTPTDIKGYRIEDSKYYVSKTVKGEKIFLEFLLDGIVNLYYYKVNGNETFFLEKDTSLIELTNEKKTILIPGKLDPDASIKYEKQSNKYKGDLNYAFRDDPKIFQKVRNATFDDKSLIKLTRSYHDDVCKDYACIEYTKSTKGTISIGPKISWINATMGMSASDDRLHEMQLSYGLQIQYHPAVLFYRWNIITGLEYSKNSFNGDFYGNFFGENVSRTYHIKLNYNAIRIPLVFQYTLPIKVIQPLFYLGINGVILSNPDYGITSTVFNPSSQTYSTGPEHSDLGHFQWGLVGGVGMAKNLGGKLSLNLKAGYESRFPAQNFRQILDMQFVRSISVSAGLLVKL